MDSVLTSEIDVKIYDLNWPIIKGKILNKKNQCKSEATYLAYLIK
jgi:hypothetical protein